ncbi:hypothetical protein [Chryseobacterium sp.]|uniref:hypothetical protein n=1 Tax=Chryseobacterium sp. TaxID=1871047 RepID=UPI00289C3FC8|nr:hypothetical protein [Chryseobacterium sp.]
MLEDNFEEKKLDYIQIILICVSVALMIYSASYIYFYYDYNDLLRHFPENYNSDKESLSPNEIGDSIGGTLNPIIGFTGSILTFLAFYIQYKSNKQQVDLFKKQIKNEKFKQKEDLENRHKITLRIFKSLIFQMLSYYKESGENLQKFILLEKQKPLEPNIFKFVTDASYVYFKEVNFTEIYEAMIWYFNLDNNHFNNWEDEFTRTLTKIDFYDKLISELQIKYLEHVKSKTKNLNEVGSELDNRMGEILSDEYFKNSSENGIDDYFRIIHNKNKEGVQIKEDFDGIDFFDLQQNFFNVFIKSLMAKKNILEFLNRNKDFSERLKDKEFVRIMENLDVFSKLNKRIGTEIQQTKYYVNNLDEYFNSYFSEDSKQLKSISDFISKINLK